MRIGIADTTFARVDMGRIAVEVISKKVPKAKIERYTVPGFKDLPVAAKKLLEKYNCDIVIACGWVGKEDVDEHCAQEAGMGLIIAELMTNKHILKVFFHEREALRNYKRQKEIAIDRVEKHTLNALALLQGKETLSMFAGKGRRQGYKDEGAI